MTAAAPPRKRQPTRRRSQVAATVAAQPIASSLPFFFYMLYMVSFFLHSGERFPAIAPLRPDLMSASLVILSLFPYLAQRMGLLKLPPAKALATLIIVIVVTLPFSTLR